MYIIVYFVVLSLSQQFTNQSLGINNENRYSYSFGKEDGILLALGFIIGVVLTIFSLFQWYLLLGYTVGLTIVCLIAMNTRKNRVLKIKEETQLIYDILQKFVDKKGKGLDYNNPPFELKYKYGTINQIDVQVDPANFDDKQFPIFLDQLNNFLPTYTWQYELKLEQRLVSFLGKDKPPTFAKWAGSWLQDFRFLPLGISGSGEVGIRLQNISSKKLNKSQFKDSNGDNVPIDTGMSYQPHTLICGTTGSGKSVTVNVSINHTIEHRNKIATLLLDPKFVEFEGYKDMKGVLAVAQELKDIVECLRIVRLVMYKRNSEMAKMGIKNIHQYKPKKKTDKIFVTGVDMPRTEAIRVKEGNREEIITVEQLFEKVQTTDIVEICLNNKDWIPVNKYCVEEIYEDEMPFIYIVCDELAELTQKSNEKSEAAKIADGYRDEIVSILNSIAQLGRSAGLALVICTQKPSFDVVNTNLRSNPLSLDTLVEVEVDENEV